MSGLDLQQLQRTIAGELGLHIERLVRIPSADRAGEGAVFGGLLNGERVFVKLREDARSAATEIATSALCASAGIPVPHTIGVLEHVEPIGMAVVVQRAARGISLLRLPASDRTPALFAAAGEMLNKIHLIALKGFGPLDVIDGSVQGRVHTYAEFADAQRTVFPVLRGLNIVTDAEIELLRTTMEELCTLDLQHASLVHNDYKPEHIFTDGRDITGVIDLSASYAGDPLRDVAVSQYFLHNEAPNCVDAFNRGYGSPSSDPRVSKYLLLVASHKIAYRLERGHSDRVPTAIEKLRRILHSEPFKSH